MPTPFIAAYVVNSNSTGGSYFVNTLTNRSEAYLCQQLVGRANQQNRILCDLWTMIRSVFKQDFII
jgi:hypothetical protein